MNSKEVIRIQSDFEGVLLAAIFCVIFAAIAFVGNVEASLILTAGKYLALMFIAIIIIFLFVAAMTKTELSAKGIDIRSPGQHITLSWNEVASWGSDHFPNGETSGIWVKVHSVEEKVFLQPIPEDVILNDVRSFLFAQCGPPETQSEKTLTP